MRQGMIRFTVETERERPRQLRDLQCGQPEAG